MKKLIVTGLMATAATLGSNAQAQAQTSSAEIYGIIDTGMEYITNVGPTGSSLIRMPNNTASIPSRWGIRGSEDLGDGLRAVFTLESGFGPDAGGSNQGGRLFGRQAFVGLSNSWGTLTMGRIYAMTFYATLDTDILGAGTFGSGALDSYLPNSREDNAISYMGKFSGLTVGATYSLGRDTVNAGPSPAGTNCAGENPSDSSACRAWSAMLKYDAPTWGAAVARDHMNGGPGAFGGLTNSNLSDTRSFLNGYVKFGNGRVGAGVIHRVNDGIPTPKSNLYYLGVSYPVTAALTLEAEAFRLSYKDSSSKATLLAARAAYAFSNRTNVYVTAGHISNDGGSAVSVSGSAVGSNPPVNGSQIGVMAGIRHNF